MGTGHRMMQALYMLKFHYVGRVWNRFIHRKGFLRFKLEFIFTADDGAM